MVVPTADEEREEKDFFPLSAVSRRARLSICPSIRLSVCVINRLSVYLSVCRSERERTVVGLFPGAARSFFLPYMDEDGKPYICNGSDWMDE